MRTVGNPRTLARVTARVENLSPEREWGQMNVKQMLRHLAASMD